MFSFSVHGGSRTFKEYILNLSGYIDSKGEPPTDDSAFMIKSRRIRREINVTMDAMPDYVSKT